MKKLFLMPFIGKFIVPIVLFFTAVVIYSCSKDNTVQNATNTEESVNALVQMSGGNVDDVLYDIESNLNETYSYGDQSVMNIEETESEISFPISGGVITPEQGANIYTEAKNTWADAYTAFEGENKKAFLVDIERLENSNPNEVSIKIRTTVCEPQETGAVTPCDDATYNDSKTYQTFKGKYSNKNLPFAQDYLMAKFNQKIHNDPCVVFDDPVYIPFNPEIVVSKPGALNATQMEDTHCQLWNLLKEKYDAFMAIPSNKLKYRNYGMYGVVVTSDATNCTDCANTTKLKIKGVYISKKRILPPPCSNTPKLPPLKG